MSERRCWTRGINCRNLVLRCIMSPFWSIICCRLFLNYQWPCFQSSVRTNTTHRIYRQLKRVHTERQWIMMGFHIYSFIKRLVQRTIERIEWRIERIWWSEYTLFPILILLRDLNKLEKTRKEFFSVRRACFVMDFVFVYADWERSKERGIERQTASLHCRQGWAKDQIAV